MTFLPSNGDQDWVVHELAELIARVCRERFLSAPIIEPNDRFFPDRWTGDVRACRRG